MSEKRPKGRYFAPDKLKKSHQRSKKKEKKKQRGGRKEEKRNKAIVALLVFMMATLEIVFWPKKAILTEGVFGVTFCKNPARYI